MTSVELVQLYLERIGVYDGILRSILEVNPEALQIAEELDLERKDQGARGLLHGIPILLKDNIDTGDRLHTSAGSITLADSFAAKDSFVAANLRKAGAVILGKSNMTEWANFMSPTIWAGYSSRNGLTLNPYGPGKCLLVVQVQAPVLRWRRIGRSGHWDGNIRIDYQSFQPEQPGWH